jgi:hypothetical protein
MARLRAPWPAMGELAGVERGDEMKKKSRLGGDLDQKR